MKVKHIKELTSQVLPEHLTSGLFPFVTDYYEHNEEYDTFFYRTYGEKELLKDYLVKSDWDADVASVLYLFKERLQHFWDINLAEYDPTENVFENTTVTTNRDARVNSDVMGEQKSTDTYGARNDVNNIGTNGKVGNSTTTNTNAKIPYDMQTYKETERDTTSIVNSELETTTTKGAQTDTRTEQAHTDTHNIGAEREVITTNRHGNIGVVMSSEIMRDSKKFWLEFTFIAELFRVINDELFSGLWGC